MVRIALVVVAGLLGLVAVCLAADGPKKPQASPAMPLTKPGSATKPAAKKEWKDFPANSLTKPGWVLTADDEFDGDKLNEKLWIPEYFPGRFEKPSLAKYEVKDGALRIFNGSIQTYNCHNLHKVYANPPEKVPTIDRFKQFYGYYEIRAKNSLTSHHIAYWLLEAKAGGGEIDVTEDKGWGGPNYPSMPGERHVVKHYDDITTHEERCATFHLYAIEIYEGGLRIYHDNVLLEEMKVDWKKRGEVPFMFLLGLYTQDGYDKQAKVGVGDPYVIDYFRAYKKATDSEQKETNAGGGK